MSGITNKEGTVVVFLKDIATFVDSYDKLLIYKSINGVSGNFYEITGQAAAGATLLGRKSESFDLNGKTFTFSCDGAAYSVSFTTEKTASEVADTINSQVSEITASVEDGKVRLTSNTTGLNSTLEIVSSSDGGVTLGFYEGDWDIGEAARMNLASDTKLYILIDYHSSSDWWYKYRLYSTTKGTYSDFSPPFQARPYSAIDVNYLIFGTVALADSEGKALASRAVKVTVIDSKEIDDIIVSAGTSYVYYTDSDGNAEIPLIKGSRVSVAVEGTRLVREFDVPSTGDSFSIFDPSLVEYDSFGIATYNIPDAERTSF